MRLLRATREQLRGKPTRQVIPFEVAEKAGINPYHLEYEEALRYLLDHGYMEQYADPSHWLYRVTNKGLEEIMATLDLPPSPPREETSPPMSSF
jgi:hypothetical protein